MSNHIYYISEPTLKITADATGRMTCDIDDLLTNVALFPSKVPVSFIGRVSSDVTGEIIMSRLNEKVDTAGIDRYSDAPVPLTITDSTSRPALYHIQSAEAFNPVWPRFEEGDTVVWGGYFSLDKSVHQRLMELLKYAAARHATMIYVPYFSELQVPRVTRVMPEIFDNLELADAVIATTDALSLLFGNTDMEAVYHDNIRFYAPRFYALEKSPHYSHYSLAYSTGIKPGSMSMPFEEVLAAIIEADFNS